ncbi:hypothetical protein EVAR_64783_1 [Eumeta japonica]|uniref:Uncharacterized protein n=1 Tax=Eumeta variegata TaxID=151549 RepID=A0A4C1ZT48_EUMVA|nr:hypothetical protein EVAR_64783_1 [Eumeta japonica]
MISTNSQFGARPSITAGSGGGDVNQNKTQANNQLSMESIDIDSAVAQARGAAVGRANGTGGPARARAARSFKLP